jgi:hypothetical protein
VRKRFGRVLSAGALAVLAVAAGSVAFGAIPDSGGLIHGCFNTNGSKQTNGTQLNIVDTGFASCNKNQQEVTWNQQGPPGEDGADGVSVTSAALGVGDNNCPDGGSQFTAANGVTYACNGAKGDKGDTGEAGPSAAYVNGGFGLEAIGDGVTRIVASVTVPAGSYTLFGGAHGVGIDDLEFLQCNFVAAGTNGPFAVLVNDNSDAPVLGAVTVGLSTNAIQLRCNAQGGTIEAQGQMIATRVGSVTQSE